MVPCYDVRESLTAMVSMVDTPALSLIKSELPEKWQEILADPITDPKELVHILALDPDARPHSKAAISAFPLKVPRSFVSRMQRGDWNDPLLRQVWPDRAEEFQDPTRNTDPLQERAVNPEPGLLHKYQGRVLLIAAPHCAIHCRYCFRRHFDYEANTPGRERWRAALRHIAADNSIEEVILSGGDPLAAPDAYLQWLMNELDSIKHVQTVRIHTRLPIVIPQRVTTGLRNRLVNLRARCVVVLHCNHANELDSQVAEALDRLAGDGLTLLNQSVLLRGVNDDPASLITLNRRLFSHHVLPYYLHLPDSVVGTGHFDVSENRALALVAELREQLPGYLVPTLVREEPGQGSKTPVV